MDSLEELIRSSRLIYKGDMGVQRVYKGNDLIYKREVRRVLHAVLIHYHSVSRKAHGGEAAAGDGLQAQGGRTSAREHQPGYAGRREVPGHHPLRRDQRHPQRH